MTFMFFAWLELWGFVSVLCFFLKLLWCCLFLRLVLILFLFFIDFSLNVYQIKRLYMPGLTGCREIDLKVYTSYQFREGDGEKKQTLVRKRIAYWILRLLIQPASLPSWEFSGHLLFRGCDSGALQILTWNLGEWFVVTPHRRRPRIIIPSAFPQCSAVA